MKNYIRIWNCDVHYIIGEFYSIPVRTDFDSNKQLSIFKRNYMQPHGCPHMTQGHAGSANPFVGPFHPLYAGLSRHFHHVP